MSNQNLLDTRCPHERGGIPWSASVGDYQPLTKDRLQQLLTMAAQTKDWRLQNRIQCRLNQAIKGMRCPRPTAGGVAERSAKLDSLYVHKLQSAPELLPHMTDRFWSLLEGE